MVALTFDDNPSATLSDLLKLLRKYNATATFFPNAPYHFKSLNLPIFLQEIHDNGHQIGAHTWDHIHMNDVGNSIALENTNKMNDWLYDHLGFRSKFLRPPYGECDESCIRFLTGHDFTLIDWFFDTADWRYNINDTIATGVERVNTWIHTEMADGKHAPVKGSIVLLHARFYTTMAVITPLILESLSAKGIRFVSVAECLGFTRDQWYF
ncbi:hypothetical protein GQ44DRAFT_778671 [Phaeosphaeriaceae sp. PMI808]|nr:hypothetical protein GQ44DRAFT_778671 [Phaeosphaeriaceae sp. PMI808]